MCLSAFYWHYPKQQSIQVYLPGLVPPSVYVTIDFYTFLKSQIRSAINPLCPAPDEQPGLKFSLGLPSSPFRGKRAGVY